MLKSMDIPQILAALPHPVCLLDRNLQSIGPRRPEVREWFGLVGDSPMDLQSWFEGTPEGIEQRETLGVLLASAIDGDEIQWMLVKDALPSRLRTRGVSLKLDFAPLFSQAGFVSGFLVQFQKDEAGSTPASAPTGAQLRTGRMMQESLVEAERLQGEAQEKKRQAELAAEIADDLGVDLQDFLLESLSEVESLRRESAQRKQEAELTDELVSVGRPNLDDFFSESFELVADLEILLTRPDEGQGFRFLLGRFLHTLKGDSSMYGFTRLSREIHELESFCLATELGTDPARQQIVSDLKSLLESYAFAAQRILKVDSNWLHSGQRIVGRELKITEDRCDDILSQLSQLRESLDEPKRKLLDGVFRQLNDLKRLPSQELERRVHALIKGVEERLKKTVSFSFSGSYHRGYSRERLRHIQAILGHLIRNSMDHGIESEEERVEAGKSPKGSIRLEIQESAGGMQITLSDDGRGIDTEALSRKAIAAKLRTSEELVGLSHSTLLELIFEPGLSSKTTVQLDSGRGIGMSAAKILVEESGGTLAVESVRGAGTQFRVFLPD
jgi:signal transduction histidine kinase